MERGPPDPAETETPAELRGLVDALLEGVEARLGWPVTLPPATLEIRLKSGGGVRLYARLEREVRE
jgi:hypothetical protein